MKNKYIFWMVCWMSLATGLTGCKELTCDFSYSPTTPAAGRSVVFSNMSTGADDYLWSFGDNTTSTGANPSHIYRKPGTYTVTLLIKRNKTEHRTRTQHITVIDTIPSIACNMDTVYAYTPTKFSAAVYNPWQKAITCQWSLPEGAVVLSGNKLDSTAVVCYFTKVGSVHEVGLTIQLGDEPEHQLTYSFTPRHALTSSVLYMQSNRAYEQYRYRIAGRYVYQATEPTTAAANLDSLRHEQDTVYHYGPTTYTVASVGALLQQDIRGFQVDRLMSKIYAYGPTGLWVCNMMGNNATQLVHTAVLAIKIDGAGNRLYWATTAGLWEHALLKTMDNLEPFAPQPVTGQYTEIATISVNPALH